MSFLNIGAFWCFYTIYYQVCDFEMKNLCLLGECKEGMPEIKLYRINEEICVISQIWSFRHRMTDILTDTIYTYIIYIFRGYRRCSFNKKGV